MKIIPVCRYLHFYVGSEGVKYKWFIFNYQFGF